MELFPATPDLPAADLYLLVQILNGAWGDLVEATPDLLRKRFESGQLFVVVRDAGTQPELDFIRATYQLEILDGRIPIGLLETIDAVTAGDASRVPSPYALLTAGGAWRAPLADADTLVFVDLTTAISRQRSGIGRDIVRYGLSQRKAHHRHAFTFTPHVPATMAWHEKRGARASGVVLPGARPGHSVPDVHVMDYSTVTPEQVS